jgi:ATP-dependent protease ClpP protease subunit
MTEPQTEDVDQEEVDLTRAIYDAEKASHEARIAELDAARKELELLEAKINLDYQLCGRYSFHNQVNQGSVKKLIRMMRIWDRHRSDGDWVIDLNSLGGEVRAGSALLDEIHSYSIRGGGTHHITIRVRGLAASMAGVLLQAADVRLIGKSSQLMIHESQGGVIGGHSAINQEADWHDRWRDYMVSVFLARTDKITRAQFLRKIANGREWYLHSDEAVACGFVDGIG